MRCLLMVLAALAVASASARAQESSKYYELPKGDYPHDVAVRSSGEVWYAGQNLGIAGRLNPASGEIERISLGKKSAPHGVIVGPDGAPWFTDGGQNAIVRVDPATKQVKIWPLPAERMPYTTRFRRQGPHLVHGTERYLWPAQSDGGRYEGLGCTVGASHVICRVLLSIGATSLHWNDDDFDVLADAVSPALFQTSRPSLYPVHPQRSEGAARSGLRTITHFIGTRCFANISTCRENASGRFKPSGQASWSMRNATTC
jgi:hypothetical protein